MVPGIHRPAVVRVNLAAIHDNVENEIKHLDPGQKLFAVVKANAYGHGSVEVAKTAAAAGASGFCVAILDEALQLRRADIVQPILVLGIVNPLYSAVASANDISLTAPSLDWLKASSKVLLKAGRRLKIHLAIDSGMGRIGFTSDQEFIAANDFLLKHHEFCVEGMFAHFASADSKDHRYFDRQITKFRHMKDLLKLKPKWIHVDNTAASILHQGIKSDLVRFGIGLYGLNPSSTPDSPDLKPEIKLRPALSFVSELTYVKTIHKGDGVSYGSTFVADHDTIIGTVPVGYADGWIRKFQGFKVKVGRDFCPIVGRVCMDQFMVALPARYKVGTKVELISSDPAAPNSLKKAADYVGTIHYEVACLLSDRLPREYYCK